MRHDEDNPAAATVALVILGLSLAASASVLEVPPLVTVTLVVGAAALLIAALVRVARKGLRGK